MTQDRFMYRRGSGTQIYIKLEVPGMRENCEHPKYGVWQRTTLFVETISNRNLETLVETNSDKNSDPIKRNCRNQAISKVLSMSVNVFVGYILQ